MKERKRVADILKINFWY